MAKLVSTFIQDRLQKYNHAQTPRTDREKKKDGKLKKREEGREGPLPLRDNTVDRRGLQGRRKEPCRERAVPNTTLFDKLN